MVKFGEIRGFLKIPEFSPFPEVFKNPPKLPTLPIEDNLSHFAQMSPILPQLLPRDSYCFIIILVQFYFCQYPHLPLNCRSRFIATHALRQLPGFLPLSPFQRPSCVGCKNPLFTDLLKIETDFFQANASRFRGTEFLLPICYWIRHVFLMILSQTRLKINFRTLPRMVLSE